MRFFVFLFFVTIGAFAKESTIKIALVQEWTNLNPVTNQLASNDALAPFVVRKMVARDSSGKALPDVAEKIPELKGKTAVWNIRSDAKWGDGASITCADWELGWRVGLAPTVTTNFRQDYNKIEKIVWDKKKPKECVVTYAQASWSYDRDLPALLPFHRESEVFEKHKDAPEGYDRNSSYVTNPTDPALYNGPYLVNEFKMGSHMILSRNPHFYGTKPNIDRFVIKHISDTGTLKAHLLSKEIDMISAVGFPPDTAMNLDEEFENKKLPFQVKFQDSFIFQGIFFNLDNEIFKDANVRRALSVAVDKELIVKAFFRNRLVKADGILAPHTPGFSKGENEFSQKKARELLDQAGWKLEAGQTVRKKNGKALSLIFKTSAGIKVLELVQQQVCSGFKEVGVDCVIKNEPPRILLGSSVPKGEFDLSMFGAPIPADSSLTGTLSSKEVPSKENSWTGGNSYRIRSAMIDQLLQKFDKEMKYNKRVSLLQEIAKQVKINYLLIPIYHRREAIVAPRNLNGLQASFDGTSFSFPEKWTLD